MPDLGDLFPGFASRTVSTEAGRLVARLGGAGPPLARAFTGVTIDLRGYVGHFIAEEAPAATEASLLSFFRAAAA